MCVYVCVLLFILVYLLILILYATTGCDWYLLMHCEDNVLQVLTNLRYLKGFCSFTEDIQVKLAKYGRHME